VRIIGAALGSIIANVIAPHIDAVTAAAEKLQAPSGSVRQNACIMANHEPAGAAISSAR
jgi:hypothetical protein